MPGLAGAAVTGSRSTFQARVRAHAQVMLARAHPEERAIEIEVARLRGSGAPWMEAYQVIRRRYPDEFAEMVVKAEAEMLAGAPRPVPYEPAGVLAVAPLCPLPGCGRRHESDRWPRGIGIE